MSWNESPQPVTIRNVRRIGDIVATVTLEETGTDEMEITQHPVQRGADITDHAYVKPAGLAMRIGFNGADQPLETTYQQLLDLQVLREPFVIVTGQRVYQNMLFKSLGKTTDKTTDQVLVVSCTFQQVIIVDVVVTTVPPRAKQKNPGKTGGTAKAGAKQAKPEDSPTKKSGLQSLFGR